MNSTDREMMVRDYERASNEAQNIFEYSIIRLQDAAYSMGYERGCSHQSKMLKALEDAANQLNELGYQAAYQEISELIDEVCK